MSEPDWKSGWPLLEYRDGTQIIAIGQVRPFNDDESVEPGRADYLLYGFPVRLTWSYDWITRVLADSKESAESLLRRLGPHAEK